MERPPDVASRLRRLAAFLAPLAHATLDARPIPSPPALPAPLRRLALADPVGDVDVVQDDRDVCHPGTIEELLRLAAKERLGAPTLSLLYATLGVAASAGMAAGPWKKSMVLELAARTAGQAANALRQLDRKPEAKLVLEQALELVRGSDSPGTEATLLRQAAALACWENDHETALSLLHQAKALYAELGDRQALGWTLCALGNVNLYRGQLQKALYYHSQGLQRLDPELDPLLYALTVFNIAWVSLEARNLEDARAARGTLEDLAPQQFPTLLRLRLSWLDARLALADGRLEAGQAILLALRGDFAAEGRDYEFVLVSLELAAQLLRSSRTTELLRVIEEMEHVLRREAFAREALASYLILHQEATSGMATRALLNDLRRRLRPPRLALQDT